MKKWFILVVAILGISASANAQSFGVKLIGVQYNTFDPGRGSGLQVALSTLFVSFDLEVNYIIGREILSDDKKFSFFYGAGAHAGFLGFFSFGTFGVGAHGIVGLEYLIQPSTSIGVSLHPGISVYFGNIIGPFVSPYFGGGLFVNFRI
ncbi:MAG: hypothetical protein ACK41E_07310 [Deinococcales bacterium]